VHHTYPSVPFYRLPALHAEIEAKLGFALPTSTYFELHRSHLKQLFTGETELDVCAAHDKAIVEAGHLGRLTGEAELNQCNSGEEQTDADAHA
jgi:hypothetical protein